MEQTSVRSLFDSIAHRYDLLNHLLSGGIDIRWRSRLIEKLSHTRPERILDVACGTADLSIAAAELKPVSVLGVDIAEKMLSIGREKIRQRGLDGLIELRTGAAERLEFEDKSFDAVMVSFGVRNFENLQEGLREMYRVLRDQGTLAVLEFSRPATFPVRQIYQAYFRFVLPAIGRLISKHPYAYRYLHDTVMTFPEGEAFLALLRSTGFREAAGERLTFGIATIYTATRKEETK